MNSPYNHSENPQCTRAFQLVNKGQRDKAIAILKEAGYADADCQVQLFEDFMKTFTTSLTSRGKNGKRLLARH
jgi:hypothetical protein